MKPISAYTIKINFENNPDTPISAANLSKSVDYVASYLESNFEGTKLPAGTILTTDLVGDPTTFVEPKLRLLMKRGTVFSIINEATNTAGQQIIPANDKYRVFDVGLEDLYITLQDRDEAPSNSTMTQWGANREWFVYVCDKDDSSSYNKDNPDEYGGGAEILVSLKRYDSSGNIEMWPDAIVPGRASIGAKYSKKDTRIIGGFKSDALGFIIPSSVWDISGKFNEVKATKFSIIDEFGVAYDDRDINGLPIQRSIYRPLRPGDLDTLSTSWNNVFENTVTVNGNLIVGGVDPRPGPGLGSFFNSKSNRAEMRFNEGFFLQTNKIQFNATTIEQPRDIDFLDSTIDDGMSFLGNYQHKNGDVVFNDGSSTLNRNYSFTVRTINDPLGFHVDPNDSIGLGIQDPTARLDIANNGPEWIKDHNNDPYKRGLRIRDKSAIVLGNDSDSGKFYGITSSDNNLYFIDTNEISSSGSNARYLVTINDSNLGIGTRNPQARIHELTSSLNGSVVDDNLLLEDTRLNKGSNIVLKDVTNTWEIGSQSALISSDKEGFFIYNRNYISDSTKKRNFIFITPDGKIGSGTQIPDEDFQIEKEKNSDTYIKVMNTSLDGYARAGMSFFNEDSNLSKFELGVAGRGYINSYTSWKDAAYIHTKSDISNGLKVEVESGNFRISVSGKEKNDFLMKSKSGSGSYVGINIPATTIIDDAAPEALLDIRNTLLGSKITMLQLKTEINDGSGVGIKIQGSQYDKVWPTEPSGFIDFWTRSASENPWILAKIEAANGTRSVGKRGGGLVFSTSDQGESRGVMFLTDTGRVGIGNKEANGGENSLPNHDLDVRGNIGIDEYLSHNDNGTTFIKFSTDELHAIAGSKQVLWFKKNASAPHVVSIGNSTIVNNSINNDIESPQYLKEITTVSSNYNEDNDLDINLNSLMYLDSSEHKVLIGNQMPSSILPLAELDIAFNKDVVQYIRTTTTDKNAALKIRGARTAITNEISSLVFENSSVESAKIVTKLNTASTNKTDLLVYTNNGTADTEALRINSEQDLLVGFTSGQAKIAVNGGVHVGGTTDPGDNNLEVDGNLYLNNTLYHQTSAGVYDSDTYIAFADDSINIVAGGTKVISLAEGADPDLIRVGQDSTTDIDFNGVIYLDKSATAVGINNTAPSYDLDVTGNLRATTNMLVGTSAIFNDSKDSAGNFTVRSQTSDNILYINSSTNRISINSATSAPGYELSIYNNLYTEGNAYLKGIMTAGGKDPVSAGSAGYKGWIEGSLKTTLNLDVGRSAVFNSDKGAYNFVVHGDTLDNLIYTTTGNQVAIGTSTVQANYLLTVAGNQYTSGNQYVAGNQTIIGTTSYTGDVTLGATSKLSNTTLSVLAGDAYNAIIEARGGSQGTGIIYVGQGSDYGGGIFYNGDLTPAFATGEASDRISFFRRSANANEVVFSYSQASNDVSFRGAVDTSGALTVNGTGLSTIKGSLSVEGANTTLTGDLAVNGGNVTIGSVNTELLVGSGNSLRIETNSGYVEIGPQNTSISHFSTDRPAFYFNKAVQIDGNLSRYNFASVGRGAITGYNIDGSYIQTSIASTVNDLGVSQVLRWKQYGNGHVIFDASNSTSPTGSAVNNSNSTVQWAPTHPVLMGWNGSQTYGVKVDRARYAENVDTTQYANLAINAQTCQNIVGTDYYRFTGSQVSGNGYAEIATAINGNEPIYVRQYTGVAGTPFQTVARTLTLLDASGNSSFPGTITATLSGNASTASAFNSSRTLTINGAASTTTSASSSNGNYTVDASGLAVNNTNQVRGVNFHADATAPSGSARLNMDGYFYATRVYNAVWNDLAEFMWKAPGAEAEAGNVLVAVEGGVRKSNKRADVAVVGVYSDSYGFALYQDEEDKKFPVGMTGTVKVKVKGPVKIGDQLVSYKDGYAIKASFWEKIFKRDALLGKVIDTKKDNDRVLILIK